MLFRCAATGDYIVIAISKVACAVRLTSMYTQNIKRFNFEYETML